MKNYKKLIGTFLMTMVMVAGSFSVMSCNASAITQTRVAGLIQGTMTFNRDSKGNVSNARAIQVKENKYVKYVMAYVCSSKIPKKYNNGKYYKIVATGRIIEIGGDKYQYNTEIRGFH